MIVANKHHLAIGVPVQRMHLAIVIADAPHLCHIRQSNRSVRLRWNDDASMHSHPACRTHLAAHAAVNGMCVAIAPQGWVAQTGATGHRPGAE